MFEVRCIFFEYRHERQLEFGGSFQEWSGSFPKGSRNVRIAAPGGIDQIIQEFVRKISRYELLTSAMAVVKNSEGWQQTLPSLN